MSGLLCPQKINIGNTFWFSYFDGYRNKDVAFLHKESKTLIEADLLFNTPCNEQASVESDLGWQLLTLSYSTRNQKKVENQFSTSTLGLCFTDILYGIWVLIQSETLSHKIFSCSDYIQHRVMKRDARTVASWDFERIIPCHGVGDSFVWPWLEAHRFQDVIEGKGKDAWMDVYKFYL